MTILTVKGTRYKSVSFRSQLEARWAIVFDELGVKWRYEPERFAVTIRGTQRTYLPDFYLPDHNAYAEVKGDWRSVELDYWELLGHGLTHQPFSSSSLIFLGDIPYSDDPTVFYPPHFIGPLRAPCAFHGDGILCEQAGVDAVDVLDPGAFKREVICLLNVSSVKARRLPFKPVDVAFDKARAARFQ